MRLHYPPSGPAFAGRKALGLSYRSQRQTAADRCASRSIAIRNALGDAGHRSLVAPLPLKPRWMHWRRYEELCGQYEHEEAQRTKLLLPGFQRFAKRVGIGAPGA